jgi:hypothetical protein
VHYGVDFDNAFWNGAQMVYGDGSGRVFVKGALAQSIDVVGHELTHGVTSFTANLAYSKQSGALNESFSDVFGSLVKQRHLNQTADQADWLIGAGTLVPALGKALRSMSAPGTAYDGDRQPDHMDGYVDLPDDNDPRNDNGGVIGGRVALGADQSPRQREAPAVLGVIDRALARSCRRDDLEGRDVDVQRADEAPDELALDPQRRRRRERPHGRLALRGIPLLDDVCQQVGRRDEAGHGRDATPSEFCSMGMRTR